MISKKVNAYTISEILVVLVISSIVISIAFTVLNLVQKQTGAIRKNFSKEQNNILIDRLLWQDFNLHPVSYNLREDSLIFTNNLETIVYYFSEDYILRQQDTIKVKIANKTLFLEGNIVTEGTIDAIELQTEKIYKSNKIFVFKQKDAAYYLNQ